MPSTVRAGLSFLKALSSARCEPRRARDLPKPRTVGAGHNPRLDMRESSAATAIALRSARRCLWVAVVQAHHAALRSASHSSMKTENWFQLRIVGVAGPEIANGVGAFLYVVRTASPALVLHPRRAGTHHAESEAPPTSVASQSSHPFRSSLHSTEPHPSWLTQSR